jgi:hypothetical protein
MKLGNNKAQRRYYTSGIRIITVENTAEIALFLS